MKPIIEQRPFVGNVFNIPAEGFRGNVGINF